MALSEALSLVAELLHRPDSAIAQALNHGPIWTTSDYLTAHLFQAFTGEPHPALPKESKRGALRDPQRQAAMNRAKARAADRQARIKAGDLT